jgi:hypothetical protein
VPSKCPLFVSGFYDCRSVTQKGWRTKPGLVPYMYLPCAIVAILGVGRSRCTAGTTFACFKRS